MLVQRVSRASVTVAGAVCGAIGPGLLVFLGVEEADTTADAEWLAGKLTALRIFSDEAGKMNRDVCETGGDVLVVSQFTLHASTKKGNRPSFIRAARPEQAVPLYEDFKARVAAALDKPVAAGVFGADMQVELVNDGPVTLWLDSLNRE